MSGALRALIVDDEPIARRGVRRLLESENDVDVIGEASNGRAAVDAIESLHPDVVLLDIRMPEMSGIEVVSAIGAERMPAVVFLTAFDDHALAAFEVNAVDYVLKPVDPDRFRKALARVRLRLRAPAGSGVRVDESLRRVTLHLQDRFVVRSVGKIQFVPLADVDWMQSEDNYIRLHAGGTSYLIRETMTAMEARLDPAEFVRIRSSAILRIDRIREIRPLLNGTYEFWLRDGSRVSSSRRYRATIERLLG